MLKNITKLEHKVGDRVYHFICDNDSPLGEVHDAINKFKDFVVGKINELHQTQAQMPTTSSDEVNNG